MEMRSVSMPSSTGSTGDSSLMSRTMTSELAFNSFNRIG